MFLKEKKEFVRQETNTGKLLIFQGLAGDGLYLFAYKMFFWDGKMFLKKRQNLLTIRNFLLKSIYLTENTFVSGTKAKENGG